MGLGPSQASEVLATLGQNNGDPVLDRIFRQNLTTPNFLTVLLGRAGDPTDTFVGDITVGETVSPFDNITSQPKLPVKAAPSRGGQHWVTLLDKDGIIGPDGQHIVTPKKATGGQLAVLFDSGFTFPQVSKCVAPAVAHTRSSLTPFAPRRIADAIYSRVPSANFVNVPAAGGNMWTLPCSTELNVSYIFANVTIPVHPLDTVTSAFHGPPDAEGNPTCVGAFQPLAEASDQDYDIILGMAFCTSPPGLVSLVFLD